MKWDIKQDFPAFPVHHRDEEKLYELAGKDREQLPKKLDWQRGGLNQKWELWLDVGKNTLSDVAEKGATTNI